jgi:DNA-binding MltR family transcriptional regulator
MSTVPAQSDDLAIRIEVAYAKGVYPRHFPAPMEFITALCETLEDSTTQFAALSALPERFHEYLTTVARGSCAPAPDDRTDLHYIYDLDRWLRAIAVEATFVDKSTIR